MLAISRTAKVAGRIKREINSIKERKGIRTTGVEGGRKCSLHKKDGATPTAARETVKPLKEERGKEKGIKPKRFVAATIRKRKTSAKD